MSELADRYAALADQTVYSDRDMMLGLKRAAYDIETLEDSIEGLAEEIERLETGLRQIVDLKGKPVHVGDSNDFYNGVLQGHENASIIAARYLRPGAEESNG